MAGEHEPLPLDTWADLLSEWYDPDSGRIEIGPTNLHDLRRDLQRAQIALDWVAGAVTALDDVAVERTTGGAVLLRIADQQAAAVTR